MNKRGVEHQFFFAIETVLGVIVAGILLSAAANVDSLSSTNKLYAQQDFELLAETLLAAPGSIDYTYTIKSIYMVELQDNQIILVRDDTLFAGYSYKDILLSKAQGSKQLKMEKKDA